MICALPPAPAVLCEVNVQRRIHHLRALRTSALLTGVAQGQAEDMVLGGYFGDNSTTGLTPLQRIGGHGKVGQCIGWGAKNPRAMVYAWIHSPPHRRLILAGNFTKAGAGVVRATYVLDLK